MTHTYTLSGLTCNNCAAKVKTELLKNPDVTSAEITLDPQQAVISMSRHLPIDNLQSSVSKAGHYSISEISSGQTHHNTSAALQRSQSWLQTYRPLLLIFAFITSVSLLTSFHDGFHGVRFMNTFMAGFFLVFSFFKFLDLEGFAGSYAAYDLLAMRIKSYGVIYPFIELGLGLAYLSGFNPTFTNWATVIVMGFSSLGVIRSVLKKEKIQCACLGAVFQLPMSTVTIIEDLLMVIMAGVMLIFVSWN